MDKPRHEDEVKDTGRTCKGKWMASLIQQFNYPEMKTPKGKGCTEHQLLYNVRLWLTKLDPTLRISLPIVS
jgi:hypothetical protein